MRTAAGAFRCLWAARAATMDIHDIQPAEIEGARQLWSLLGGLAAMLHRIVSRCLWRDPHVHSWPSRQTR